MKNQREVNFLKCKFSTKLPGFLNQKLVRKWSEIGCRNSKTSPKKNNKRKNPQPEAKLGPNFKKILFDGFFGGAVLTHPRISGGVHFTPGKAIYNLGRGDSKTHLLWS